MILCWYSVVVITLVFNIQSRVFGETTVSFFSFLSCVTILTQFVVHRFSAVCFIINLKMQLNLFVISVNT